MDTDYGLIAGISRFLNFIAQENLHSSSDRHMKNAVTSYGFSHLSSGGYRAVFTHPLAVGLVFKVTYDSHTHFLADIEYTRWQESTPTERKFLAETYHAESHVAVMEFIAGVPLWRVFSNPEAHRGWEKFWTSSKNVATFWPWRYADVHGGNFIITQDNRSICIDYQV